MPTVYIRPIALVDSPQTEDGEAIRLCGGLSYASRFALIVREDGRVISRRRLGAGEVPEAVVALPDSLAADASDQWDNLRKSTPLWHAVRA